MKETIVLADNLNVAELRRSLAKVGINTFGLRVFSGFNLAMEALFRSGIVVNKKILQSIEQFSIIYSFLNEIEYFSNASYNDAINLTMAIHTMRHCIVEGNVLDQITEKLNYGEFKKKNEAIIEAYTRYENFLYQFDATDADEIIRYTAENAKPIDAEFLVITEFKISPLERKLIEQVSDGNYKTVSIFDLYKVKKAEIKDANVFKAYGSINEAQAIIEDIFKNHKLDECVIACTDTRLYSQLFYDLSLQYQISVSFGTGISVNNSNPAKLLKFLVNWDSLGYNGVDALYDLLTCEALDWTRLANFLNLQEKPNEDQLRSIAEYAGNLKLSTDKQSNDEKLLSVDKDNEIYELACNLAKAFEMGIIDFLDSFCEIRDNNNVDQIALDNIIQSIKIFEMYNPGKLMSDVIPMITNANVNPVLSAEGALHITSLDGLFSCNRKYVYICGLSANEFPGKAIENYLLLDTDLANFEGSTSSELEILDKIKLFEDITSFVESLGCKQKLSYSYYDLSELKEQNASSVLFNLGIDLDNIKKVHYFDCHLDASREICEKYKEGVEVSYELEKPKFSNGEDVENRAWSFSAIDTYFDCPRKFYLRYILNIPEIETTDPLEILNAADFGTLAHDMMEYLGRQKPPKDVFLNACVNAFDFYLKHKPAVIEEKKNAARQEFVDVMSAAYNFDIKNSSKIEFSEKFLKAKHEPSGLTLIGRPDRVEVDADAITVVDFKTGKTIKHEQNDPKTCLQILIYAFLCEQNNQSTKINKGEFRYLRNSGVISCAYDNDAKAAMDEILKEFSEGLHNLNFERCNKHCNYCTYSDICLLPGEIDDEKEGDGE